VSAPFESLGGGRYRVAGDLDFATVPDVWQQSRAALDDSAEPVIDLGGVRHVDSAGLALVIEWLRWARRNGRRLSFVAVPKDLHALARISEVEEFLDGATRKG
jgi:phospholipid transport system transporter-binding protein